MEKRRLKCKMASEYLGISPRYLRELTAQGRIPYHKVGTRCHIYDVRDLDKFMDDCRIAA